MKNYKVLSSGWLESVVLICSSLLSAQLLARDSLARVVELADTQVSEACPRKGVLVQVQSRAPIANIIGF